MTRDTTPLEGQLKNFITDGTPPEVIALYESLPERARAGHFGPFDGNVVVLDTETTGCSLTHAAPGPLAAARPHRSPGGPRGICGRCRGGGP